MKEVAVTDGVVVAESRTLDEINTSIWAINLLDNHGLSELWTAIQLENTGSLLPYHNEQHLLNVVAWAGKLYMSESNVYDALQMKILLAAAACHDMNHSGGRLPDSDNIQAACFWMTQFSKTVKDPSLVMFFKHCLGDVQRLIRVTQFPFVRTPTSSMEKILRDADLLQNFDGHCVKYLRGLSQEFATAGMVLTNEELIARQEVFMRDVVFYTYTGQKIKEILGPQVFARQAAGFIKQLN